MNPEIQQNTAEIKKPQMYVSWRLTFLNFLVVVLVTNSFSLFQSDQEMRLIGLLLTLSTLPVGIILLLIIAISKKPMGYINTKIMNSIFLVSVLIPAPFVFVVGSFGAGLGGQDVRGVILGYVVFSVVGVYGTSILNRKFQKLESELKI